jgi:hypothetical protein
MQQVYFFFLVTFVLLVTAIGSSLVATLQEILESPFKIFGLLANSLPTSSHFYLNYVVTNWGTQGTNLTRSSQLHKFIKAGGNQNEDAARKKAEPEDPDYHGIGSRTARFTLIMVIVLTFCTLSPLIIILGIVFFYLCRLVMGYLFVYSEDVKPDLGGAFYVRSLYHTMFGLGLYVILMCGVLYERASNEGPGLLAGAAIIPLLWSYFRFERRFKWDKVPNDYLQMHAGKDWKRRKCDRTNYVQPELNDPIHTGNTANQNSQNQNFMSSLLNSTFSSTQSRF